MTIKVPMDKFKLALITLLFLTLAVIGAIMYCEGIIGWVESGYGFQDGVFRDFPPILPYVFLLQDAWIGFAVLSILWIVFGFVWLKFTKETAKKFKAVSIASIVATLALLTVNMYHSHSGVIIRPLRLHYLIYVFVRLGFLALFALWIVLGVVWLKAEKKPPPSGK